MDLGGRGSIEGKSRRVRGRAATRREASGVKASAVTGAGMGGAPWVRGRKIRARRRDRPGRIM